LVLPQFGYGLKTGRSRAHTRIMAGKALSRTEIYLLPPIVLGVAALAFFAHRIVGFLGIACSGC